MDNKLIKIGTKLLSDIVIFSIHSSESPMIMISNFLFNFINFCVIISYFDLITNTKYFIFNSSKSSSGS